MTQTNLAGYHDGSQEVGLGGRNLGRELSRVILTSVHSRILTRHCGGKQVLPQAACHLSDSELTFETSL